MFYRWILYILIISLLVTCHVSGYDLLLDKTIDPTLKGQLKDFASQGIEKPWPNEFKKKDFVEAAKKYLGVSYRSGGINTKGLDCSGLVYLAARDVGLKLPHKSADIARFGEVVPTKGRLRKGDLVFFKGTGHRFINHVGIMINKSEFIHVSSTKGCVYTSIDDEYWSDLFVFGTR
nr:C40 family peptidase [uncultured Carboxylicivirga sp.]